MIQPEYTNGLTYNVKTGPLNTARLIGDFGFESQLYSGKVNFVINVNEAADLEVSEFSLPSYDITVVKAANGLWQRTQTVEQTDVYLTEKQR